MNEIFGGLKKHTILSIFHTALSKRVTSRRDISNITSLSFSTVTKACDSLVELNILKQCNSYDPTQKRRSRILSPKAKYWIGIYVIEKETFYFHIYDLGLKLIHTYKHIPEDTVFVDDAVKDFLRQSYDFAKKHVKPDFCCRTAMLVPAIYDEKEDIAYSKVIHNLHALRLKSFSAPFTFGTELNVIPIYSAHNEAIKKELSENEAVLSLFLERGNLISSYVTKRTPSPIALNELGRLPCAGKDINHTIRKPPMPDDLFIRLADIVFSVCHALPVTKITICDCLYYRPYECTYVFNGELTMKFQSLFKIPPEVTHSDLTSKALSHTAYELREIWFVEDILKEDYC